jgi:hypothetical protein
MQLRTFAFMSGANRYRLQAASWEEALQIAYRELNPDENARQVIRHTLYEEAAARAFRAASDESEA